MQIEQKMNRRMSSSKTKKGNILLVANYESDVGYAWWLMENYWVEIARHFGAHGRTCFLVYPKIGAIPRRIEESGIRVHQHDFSDHSVTALRRLQKLIVDNHITAIYLTDRPYHSWSYLLLRLSGIRRIVIHDHTPGERPPVAGLRRLLKTWLYKVPGILGDHFIGVSRFVFDRMIANACVPRERCSYVLNGIEPIQRNPDFQYYAHDVFKIPRDSRIVVSTGRATYYKGIDFLIRCAARVIRECHKNDVYFIHCGSGPDLESFRRLTRELRVDDRFILAGQRSDVRQILQSCDIGIQASKGEAFSLSILEYLSAGVATIVPDNCGNAEAVENRVNGILYRTGDLDDAVKRLLELIDDKQLRNKLATAGIESVTSKFHIQRANRELVAVLEGRL